MVEDRNANPTIQRAIDDLHDLMERLSSDEASAQNVTVKYLSANRHHLAKWANAVFASTTEEERAELKKRHQELDESVIGSSFREIALDVLEGLEEEEAGLLVIDDDQVHMLVRALRYAKYLLPNANERLANSPIR
jgi:hypothetical protein